MNVRVRVKLVGGLRLVLMNALNAGGVRRSVDLSQSTTAYPRINRERIEAYDGHLHTGVHVEPLVRAREHRQYEHRDLRAPQDISER